MLLTFEQTAARLGAKSRSFIYDRLAEGTLPKPVQVGERALRFPAAEVDAVIAARISGKSKAEIQALVTELHIQRAKADAGTLRQAAPAPEPKADGLHLVGA